MSEIDVSAANIQVLSFYSSPSAALFHAAATKLVLATSTVQHGQMCCVGAVDLTSKGALVKARSNLAMDPRPIEQLAHNKHVSERQLLFSLWPEETLKKA